MRAQFSWMLIFFSLLFVFYFFHCPVNYLDSIFFVCLFVFFFLNFISSPSQRKRRSRRIDYTESWQIFCYTGRNSGRPGMIFNAFFFLMNPLKRQWRICDDFAPASFVQRLFFFSILERQCVLGPQSLAHPRSLPSLRISGNKKKNYYFISPTN